MMLLTKDSSESSAVFLPEEREYKKIRLDSDSSLDSIAEAPSPTSTIRNLELERVKELFQDYDLLNTSGAVACVVCGKSYKSKVCVKKHLWEHSVYWDLFDGLKKQQRVLSIQAALILAIKFNPSLSLLLVTQSSNNLKKTKSSSEKLDTKRLYSDTNSPTKNIAVPQDFSAQNNNNNNNSIDLSGSRKRKMGHILAEEEKRRTFKVYSEFDLVRPHVAPLQIHR